MVSFSQSSGMVADVNLHNFNPKAYITLAQH